ncbi:MAG TPA: type IX secretion system membrane protein PorP/SprF [Flavobacterium sp.]|nr:type IX secretion system membrane protein PorP/SprF [Flavobacterium sp.]
MNIFKKPLLIALASVFSMQFLQAQEGVSVYSDYLTDNYYLVHPSMAGAANCAKIRLTARQQWFDENNSPAMQTLSFNTKVGERSGVGAVVFNDRNGYHSQMGAKLTYAHHIQFSRSDYDLNQLSFGISGGMAQTTVDQSTWNGPFDPEVIQGLEMKDSYFLVDVGASYHFLDFYTHFTVKNAFTSKREIYSDIESDNLRRYLFSAGYVFGKFRGFNNYRDKGFTWEPSVMLQYVEATEEKLLDVNLKMYKEFDNGQFFAGLSYRTALEGAEYLKDNEKVGKQYYHSLSPLLGVRYNNLMIGYTYSHHFGEVQFANGGFHQITLGFNFGCKDSSYKCNCPSVNF